MIEVASKGASKCYRLAEQAGPLLMRRTRSLGRGAGGEERTWRSGVWDQREGMDIFTTPGCFANLVSHFFPGPDPDGTIGQLQSATDGLAGPSWA